VWGGERCRQGSGGGNLAEKETLGRPMYRWEDDIKIDRQEMVWEHGLE